MDQVVAHLAEPGGQHDRLIDVPAPFGPVGLAENANQSAVKMVELLVDRLVGDSAQMRRDPFLSTFVLLSLAEGKSGIALWTTDHFEDEAVRPVRLDLADHRAAVVVLQDERRAGQLIFSLERLGLARSRSRST